MLSKFTRWLVRISGGWSFLVGLITIGSLSYFWSQAVHGEKNHVTHLFITNNQDFQWSQIWFLIFLLWQAVQSIVFGVGLVRYSLLSDADFCANKWALLLFSLSLGGFFTPFVLLMMPNADEKATQVADITIVRYLGTIFIVAPIAILLSLLSAHWVISNRSDGGALTQPGIFYGTIGVCGGVSGLALFSVLPFMRSNINDQLFHSKNRHHLLHAIVIFYRVLASIQMVFLILMALLRVFMAFYNLFQSRNFLQALLDLFWLFYAIASAGYIIFVVGMVLRQLWQKKEDGLITIKKSVRYEGYQTKRLQLKRA